MSNFRLKGLKLPRGVVDSFEGSVTEAAKKPGWILKHLRRD
jgi:hypothetical protein